MPQAQQYRLRLTEGTLLVVDHDALTAWLADDRALVQPMGSPRWRLLKQFLADEQTGLASHYWEAPPATDSGRAPGRPRRWDDPPAVSALSPVAPVTSAPAPREEDDDEVFAPDLSEGDSAPWEWTLDVAPVLSEEAQALHAATSDFLSSVLEEPPAAEHDLPSLALKSLDPEPPLAEPAAVAREDESPAQADWGPGLLGRFCAAVADWSDTIAGWIDGWKEAAAHPRESQASLTATARRTGRRLGTRVAEMSATARGLLSAWRELIAGWIASWRSHG